MSNSEDISRRSFLQMATAAALATQVPSSAQAISASGSSEMRAAISAAAKVTYDLGKLKWQVAGFIPYLWSFDKVADICNAGDAEVGPIDAPVPGSVQMALLKAGILPDWNVGLNFRAAEWVENRDWVYQVQLPDEWVGQGSQIRLRCAGLDYAGQILLNGKPILDFTGSFTPYEADLKPHLKPSGNLLQIRFQPPPRWLGQFGYTSQMTEWKPRFNYTWDWIVRLVQIGIYDAVTLEVVHGAEIQQTKCLPGVASQSGSGTLQFSAKTAGGHALRVRLRDGSRVIREQNMPVGNGEVALAWDELPVELWWPNGMGSQKLYSLEVNLLDDQGAELDSRSMRVGFRRIEWKRTQGAADDAHPYLCVVNGREVFLFGVNWTPIRPNFADLSESDYQKRVARYREIGVNVFRVWGGGFPERQCLYDFCDEHGILIWQEFPLSSSGMDNFPPDGKQSMEQMLQIARSYVARLQHHACLMLWCGGNELEDNLAGQVSAQPTLTIDKHPLIVAMAGAVAESDQGRMFLPTSPYGPVGSFKPETCGRRDHWDVHGPWNLDGPVDGSWRELWQKDDAMFHSEMGAPSTSSAKMIRRYKGDLPEMPGTHKNPLWNRQPWWIEWPKFALEKGREPKSLDEFVAWSQKRQADALVLAISAIRSRFPVCGGAILWMGHDCMPCTTNASILDFDGEPKPAALALKRLLSQA